MGECLLVCPRGAITTYAYDGRGNLTNLTQAVGTPQVRETRFAYDARGIGVSPQMVKVVALRV